MRDLVLFAHMLAGVLLVVLPVIVLLEVRDRKSSWVKPLAVLTAVLAWLLLVPAGYLYLVFYPATKTLITRGPWPWTHTVVMETKEHWGLLLPLFATTAAGLVFSRQWEESRRWWVLTAVLALLLGVMGLVIRMGAGVQ